MKEEIEIDSNIDLIKVFGKNDEFLKIFNLKFQSNIIGRGNKIIIDGSQNEIEKIKTLFNEIKDLISSGHHIRKSDIIYMIEMTLIGKKQDFNRIFSNSVKVSTSGKVISARTMGQSVYMDAIINNDIVLSIGPAGTGKTYIAMAFAMNALLNNEVERIILARPAVEAGESLGYLPGNLEEKVNPYLRPLYDAIFDMISYDKFQQLAGQAKIEIAPLAFMRGRTLHDSFVILDEAQNSNTEQMKMFLTRLGLNSKMVITGDITQVDLPQKEKSGLIKVQNIIKDIERIEFIYLNSEDVIRHPIVQKIVNAYEKYS